MSTPALNIVILAGGKGERFWPLSTPEHPKPFLKFFSDRSLLQQTYDRAISIVPPERIFLVVGQQHNAIAIEQLPELSPTQILLEPVGRDTAAAIGYASLQILPQELMLVLPADHLIPEVDLFSNDVKRACAFAAEHGGPCTFGIKPERPETGFGYIKVSEAPVAPGIFQVERFVEKPDLESAESYLKHPSYFWNSGIFLWKVERIQQLLGRHLPELWGGLTEKLPYGQLQKISIDFGVMQKADRVVMLPASFRWDDLGSWNSLPRILNTDEEGNLVWGNHTGLDTINCILYTESHTILTAGIRDLVIVQRGRHMLICHKNYSDRLKELLAKIPSK